jgi:hypothetical protein
MSWLVKNATSVEHTQSLRKTDASFVLNAGTSELADNKYKKEELKIKMRH